MELINNRFQSIEKNKLIFYFSRITGLVTKAFFIIFLDKYNFDSVIDITLYYVSLQSLMIIYNNHSYFNFYKTFFNENFNTFQFITFRDYIRATAKHLVVFYSLTVLFAFIISQSIFLTLIFSVLIIIEKIFDELLRFYLFDKQFKMWSIIYLTKLVLPILLFIPLLFFLDNSFYFFLLLFIIYIVSLFFFIEKRILKIIFKILSRINFSAIKSYLKIYKINYFSKQLYSILSGNVIQIDKILLAIIASKSLLPSYYIMSQISNFTNIYTDLFYIAPRRASFIKKAKHIKKIIEPKSFFLSVSTGSFISLSAFISIYYLNIYENFDSTNAIIYLISIIVFCLVKPLGQYLFWNSPIEKQIKIELIYYFFIFILFLISFLSYDEIQIFQIVLAFLISNIIRLSLYLLKFYYNVRNN